MKERLITATMVAQRHFPIPREAMIEMIAGTYNGAIYHQFGSMRVLLQQVNGDDG
jgi:hypothetical protein